MPPPQHSPVEIVQGGVRLHVVVQPRSSTDAIAGLHDNRIRIRLAAPPVDGAANDALIAVLSRILRVPASAIEITAGFTSRRKTVVARGPSLEQARQALGLAPPASTGNPKPPRPTR